MSQKMTPQEVAEKLEDDRFEDANVTYKGYVSTGDRHEYSFENCPIHASAITDNYEIVGFGDGWFSLREK